MERRRMFVVGGTGFVGAEAVREAVARGWEVRALARSDGAAARLRALGAEPVAGDAREPEAWIERVRGAAVLVDLFQPVLPRRIGRREIEAVARVRYGATAALLRALRTLPAPERPLLVAVSGTDDLAPDAAGRIRADGPLCWPPAGFGRVGVPVRRLVEEDGAPAAFVHLGTVYGPGKAFAATILPRVAAGRMLLPAPATNRVPLVHVGDAARAIVHLAGLGRERIAGRTWIVVDPAGGATLGGLLDSAAALIGAPPPRRVPRLLMRALIGSVLLETLGRDLDARPTELAATGFAFEHPSIAEGLPPTLSALGYSRPAASPLAREAGAGHRSRAVAAGLRWRPLVIAAIAAIVAVNAVDAPLTARRLRALAGGEPVLDVRIGWGPQAARRVLDALGTAGRGQYVTMLWTVDLLLPALFGAALWAALGAGALRRWRGLALAAAVADYAENCAITALVLAHPARHDALAMLASALTASKFALYGAALLLAAAGGWLARRGRRASALAAPARAPETPA